MSPIQQTPAAHVFTALTEAFADVADVEIETEERDQMPIIDWAVATTGEPCRFVRGSVSLQTTRIGGARGIAMEARRRWDEGGQG